MTQATLFDEGPIQSSIEGLVYEPEFLSLDEEKVLIGIIQTLPLHAARYKQYQARRRVVSFGGSYDFDANRLLPGIALGERLHGLRDHVAGWLGVQTSDLVHALVAEYTPGTPLGWHRTCRILKPLWGFRLVGTRRCGSGRTRLYQLRAKWCSWMWHQGPFTGSQGKRGGGGSTAWRRRTNCGGQ